MSRKGKPKAKAKGATAFRAKGLIYRGAWFTRLEWDALQRRISEEWPGGDVSANCLVRSRVLCIPIKDAETYGHQKSDTPMPLFDGVKVKPTAAKVATAAKVKPTAAKVKPTAAKVKPTAVKVKPTAVKVKPTAVKVKPTAAKVKPTAAKVPEFFDVLDENFNLM